MSPVLGLRSFLLRIRTEQREARMEPQMLPLVHYGQSTGKVPGVVRLIVFELLLADCGGHSGTLPDIRAPFLTSTTAASSDAALKKLLQNSLIFALLSQ